MARRARALIWLGPARLLCEIRGIGPEAYSVATMRSWRDFHWSQRYQQLFNDLYLFLDFKQFPQPLTVSSMA